MLQVRTLGVPAALQLYDPRDAPAVCVMVAPCHVTKSGSQRVSDPVTHEGGVHGVGLHALALPGLAVIACPGAMISATVSFTPSTVSRPELHVSVASLVQLGLMTSVLLVPYAQPEASTYQSGSPAASRNLSVARVCHG